MERRLRILLPRSVRDGDLLETTNGMREVTKVVEHFTGSGRKPSKVVITVQCLVNPAGSELTFHLSAHGAPTHVKVLRMWKPRKIHVTEASPEDVEARDRAVFIEGFCFESGATREDALEAWAARNNSKEA
jgi:hypothetical protein